MSFPFELEEALRSGIFISGTSGTGKTNHAMNIAKLLMDNNVVVFIIDPTQAWQTKFYPIEQIITIKPIAQKQRINWNDVSTVFNTSMLSPLEQQKFIEGFCEQVMYVAIRRAHRPNIIVIFEEAHTPMYNGSIRSKKSQQTARLLTQGRNFNIRFIAITQFASMVDKLPVKMCNQRYFFCTSEPNDLRYIETMIGKHMSTLPNLKVGECIYDYGNITKRVQTPLFKRADYQQLGKMSMDSADLTVTYDYDNE